MRETRESVKSVESHRSTKSAKSTVSYEMMTQLDTRTRVFYSFGHIYNDLCASVWFSYTLLYFKLNFDDSTAGMLLMLGIISLTPVVQTLLTIPTISSAIAIVCSLWPNER